MNLTTLWFFENFAILSFQHDSAATNLDVDIAPHV
jgi:hypothetical protein